MKGILKWKKFLFNSSIQEPDKHQNSLRTLRQYKIRNPRNAAMPQYINDTKNRQRLKTKSQYSCFLWFQHKHENVMNQSLIIIEDKINPPTSWKLSVAKYLLSLEKWVSRNQHTRLSWKKFRTIRHLPFVRNESWFYDWKTQEDVKTSPIASLWRVSTEL